jgi:hypothetical protein
MREAFYAPFGGARKCFDDLGNKLICGGHVDSGSFFLLLELNLGGRVHCINR